MTAKARGAVPLGNRFMYPQEILDLIEKHNIDQHPCYEEILEATTRDLTVRVLDINSKTLQRKTPETKENIEHTIAYVSEVCEKYNKYVDEMTEEIIGLDPYSVSLGKMKELVAKLRQVPEVMRATKVKIEESLENSNKTLEELDQKKTPSVARKQPEDSTISRDDNSIGSDESERPKKKSISKPSNQLLEYVVGIDHQQDDRVQGTDHKEREVIQAEAIGRLEIETPTREVPDIVPLVMAARSYESDPLIDTQGENMASLPQPELIEGLETTIPDFRPTNEDKVLKILSDKIKESPFGQLKYVRTLKEPIEVILAYATFLFAMIGQKTVSNVTIDKRSKSDWFHINEKYRKNYIMAFYAAFRNYGNTVHKGNPYRKENTENGMIAGMTLMISTAIGASDDTFLKALDEENWKKSIYPFISGRRKLVKAEAGTKAIIDEGRFQIGPDGRGRVHPSIVDYFDHAYPLRSIVKDNPRVNVAQFVNEREESDEEPPVKTNDYFEATERKKRESLSIEDIDAPSTGRALRKRKDPPSGQPSTPRPKKKTTPSSKIRYSSTSPLAKKKKIIEAKKTKPGTKKTSGKRTSKMPYIDDDSDTIFEEEPTAYHDITPTFEPRTTMDQGVQTLVETAQVSMKGETEKITSKQPIGPSLAVDRIVAEAARASKAAKAIETEKSKLANEPTPALGPKRTARKVILPIDTTKISKESGKLSVEIETPKENKTPQEAVEDPKEADQDIDPVEDNPEEKPEAV
jgi:hypothetical protein